MQKVPMKSRKEINKSIAYIIALIHKYIWLSPILIVY